MGIENNRRFQVIFGRWRSGLDNELNTSLYQRDGRHTCSVSFGFSQNAVPRVGSLQGLKYIIDANITSLKRLKL